MHFCIVLKKLNLKQLVIPTLKFADDSSGDFVANFEKGRKNIYRPS
jgi:hypothetical protein